MPTSPQFASESTDNDPPLPNSRWIPTRATAIGITLGYAALGALWILGSALALNRFVGDHEWKPLLEIVKGCLFVSVTAILLGLMLDRSFRRIRRSAGKLQDSEARLHLVGDNLPDSYLYQYVQTVGGRPHFTYLSAGAEHIHGVKVADVLRDANCLHSQIDPEQLTALAAAEAESARSLTDFFIELRMRRPDGVVRRVLLHSKPRRSSEGLVCWDGITTDITDRKNAEQEIQRQASLIKSLLDSIPDLVFFKNVQGVYLGCNPAFAEFVGRKREEIIGRNDHELFANEVADFFREQDQIMLESLKARHNEEWVSYPDGHRVLLDTLKTPYWGPYGRLLGVLGISRDITVRKQADEQLRKLSRAVEQSPVSIVITDAAGDIEYVNPKFTELTGYTPEEVRGKNPRLLKSDDTSTDTYRELWQSIKRGETWRGEFLNRKKNGQKFWEFASISPITDDADNITHFLAVKEDITERKQLEAQFRQSQKLEAIGQLAGGVAHDFNNILAAMMMQVELSAMAEGIPADVREGLEQIRAATERAASLTRQLLLFSRQQVLQPRDLDLNEVVTSLAKMLQRIIREDVHLQLHLHPAPLLTRADAGMLDQILMNLAVNARDAMPDGGNLLIETSDKTFDAGAARVHPDAAPGRYVSLCVTDTGCGMTPDVLSRIFEPFFTTKQPGKGTGLGLATVFGIVKQHRGWITVGSEPGKGTRFQVYFPATEGKIVVHRTSSERPRLRGGSEMILLVEDDGFVRRMTRILLEQKGYTVMEATNGVEALQLWTKHRDAVALLLTDLVMPAGMTGRQLAGELQAGKPNLRVVFTSGYSGEIAGGELHLRRGEYFLQKPCPPARLLETIRQCLDG